MLEEFGKKYHSALYLVFRVIVGLMFAMHGMQKLGWLGALSPGSPARFATILSLPLWMVYFVSIVELLAGIAIALGIFARIAALIGGVDMIVALIIVHFPKNIWPIINGGELAMLYLMAFFVIFAFGTGKFSLGKELFKKELW